MELDVYMLSRLQFALTIMFHYIFPPLTIGLGWLMVIMEGMYLKTGDREYEAIARFWTGIFALVFAMGVATGIDWRRLCDLSLEMEGLLGRSLPSRMAHLPRSAPR